MAQLHINATVTKNSPVVYLPGDQRAELKIGDYFKLVGVAGVYEIGAISLLGTDTQIQLTAPFLGESGNYPALIHRDFSPEQGYPLIYAGDLDIPDLLRRWALQADSAPAAAVAAHVSEADPHPQYTTVAEAAAAAPVQSVVGKTGVVTAQQVADALELGTAATRDVTTSPTDTTAGRVLTVRAFGLGGAAVAVPGNNIDDNTIPTGFYYVTSATSGTKPPGDDGLGHLIVSREGSGVTVRQLYLDNTTDRIWTRVWKPSQWSTWQEVYHSGNLADAFKGANQSLSVNGYQKLPSGLIIQWGKVQCSASGSVNWTFPLAFPNQVLCVGPLGVMASYPQFANVNTPNLVSVPVSAWNADGSRSANGVFMLAIGY